LSGDNLKSSCKKAETHLGKDTAKNNCKEKSSVEKKAID
jgi:hypothetical protein